MGSSGDENLDSILLHDSTTFESANEDLAESIKTFHGTDPDAEAQIDNYINFLQQGFSDNESNVTIFTLDSTNDSDHIETNSTLPIVHSQSTTFSSLPPSDCVVNDSQIKSKQIHLVYPLEQTYRARYKSDYFPQNGAVRRPRYIADSAGNHFITLQLPSSDKYVFSNLYIRIALITKFIQGHGHYYSPYKFQKDHNDIQVPDENPTYIKVETSERDKFIMRLQLVLIKSKLDQLNDAQPLQPFSDCDSTVPIQNIIHTEKLAPKDLITTYQLDQSHIAFALCTKLTDGSYEIYPETTVVSTVLAETATNKKSPDQLSTTTQNVETSSHIQCPHCSHQFNPNKRSKPTSTKKCTKKAKKSV